MSYGSKNSHFYIKNVKIRNFTKVSWGSKCIFIGVKWNLKKWKINEILNFWENFESKPKSEKSGEVKLRNLCQIGEKLIFYPNQLKFI